MCKGNSYKVVEYEEMGNYEKMGYENVLKIVYKNGKMITTTTLEEVRIRA